MNGRGGRSNSANGTTSLSLKQSGLSFSVKTRITPAILRRVSNMRTANALSRIGFIRANVGLGRSSLPQFAPLSLVISSALSVSTPKASRWQS
jgi:hypothetical protein